MRHPFRRASRRIPAARPIEISASSAPGLMVAAGLPRLLGMSWRGHGDVLRGVSAAGTPPKSLQGRIYGVPAKNDPWSRLLSLKWVELGVGDDDVGECGRVIARLGGELGRGFTRNAAINRTDLTILHRGYRRVTAIGLFADSNIQR